MPDPLVTAIIPAKDRAALCTRAVESVLAQTYGSIECIVVDDGSSDGTQETLSRRFGDRVRIVRNDEYQGPARARNQAVAMARGTYIAFLDSDDEWLPAKIARQVEVAERGADVVYCRALNVTREGKPLSIQPARYRGDLWRILITGNVVGSPSKVLVRRSCLDGLPPFRTGIYSEDWELWLRLAFRFRFDFVPEVLVRMQFEPGSRHWSMPVRQLIDSVHAIYDGLGSDPLIREMLLANRRRFDATVDFRIGAHLTFFGKRREAIPYLLRSLRRDPLRLRSWKSLVVAAAGPRLTSAAKCLRSRFLSRSG